MNKYSFLIILFAILLINNCKKEDDNYNLDDNYPESIKRSPSYTKHINLFEINREDNIDYSSPILTIGNRSSDRNYIFGEIKKVKVFDSKVFLLDSRSKQLKIFSLDSGTHINTFELSGRGPGELLQPVDMLIDEVSGTLFLLDNQRKLLAYNVNNPEPELNNEVLLDYIPESFCSNNTHIIIRNRLGPTGVIDGPKGNLISYSKNELKAGKIFGSVFTSDNWLLTDQMSRGIIYCSDKDDFVYSIDRYLSHLVIFSNNGNKYSITDRVFFNDLELIRIVPSFSENQPVISYESSNRGKRAVMNNVITDKNYIFIQTYELKRTGEEIITTYQIDKKNNSLVNAFYHIGTIHDIHERGIITSKNFPFPRVEIFSKNSL